MSAEHIIHEPKRNTDLRHEFKAMCFEVLKVALAIALAEALLKSLASVSIDGQVDTISSRWIVTCIFFVLAVFAMFFFCMQR